MPKFKRLITSILAIRGQAKKIRSSLKTSFFRKSSKLDLARFASLPSILAQKLSKLKSPNSASIIIKTCTQTKGVFITMTPISVHFPIPECSKISTRCSQTRTLCPHQCRQTGFTMVAGQQVLCRNSLVTLAGILTSRLWEVKTKSLISKARIDLEAILPDIADRFIKKLLNRRSSRKGGKATCFCSRQTQSTSTPIHVRPEEEGKVLDLVQS